MPLSMTAESGTVRTGRSPIPVSKATVAYMPILSRPAAVRTALGGRLGKLRRRAADFARRAGHVLKRTRRQEIFPFGNDKFRRIDLQQRLTARHCLAGRVDVEPLDPAFELRIDGVQPPL